MFRDTAHGLLSWAVATAVIAGIGLTTAASTAGTATSAASTSATYAADTLLRSDRPTAPINAASAAQVAQILAREGGADADDRTYVANVVAAQTGIAPAEAQQRVDAAVTSVRQAVDKGRKASSAISFFTALAMLIGAFVASAAAAYGGSYRDLQEGLEDPR